MFLVNLNARLHSKLITLLNEIAQKRQESAGFEQGRADDRKHKFFWARPYISLNF